MMLSKRLETESKSKQLQYKPKKGKESLTDGILLPCSVAVAVSSLNLYCASQQFLKSGENSAGRQHSV